MASMVATASSATPFLGQTKNASPFRDVVSMGNGKYTIVCYSSTHTNPNKEKEWLSYIWQGNDLWHGLDRVKYLDPSRFRLHHTWRENSYVIMDGTLLVYRPIPRPLLGTGHLRCTNYHKKSKSSTSAIIIVEFIYFSLTRLSTGDGLCLEL